MHVLVIGGGLAGLSAALELADRGATVQVLEALPTLGGRARSYTDPGGGGVVESGGEFIGANHPTWLELADRFGLELVEIVDQAEPRLFLGGVEVPAGRYRELDEEADRLRAELIELAAPVDVDRPWLTPGAEKLDRLDMASFITSLDLPAPVERYVATVMELNDAAPLHRLSLLGQLVVVKAHGMGRYWEVTESLRCATGTTSLAMAIAGRLGEAVVELGLPVRGVADQGSSYEVSTVDGRSFSADAVVLAVPPTVWGRIDTDIDLPYHLADNIGPATKIIGEFTSKAAPLNVVSDSDLGWLWSLDRDRARPVDIAFAAGPRALRWSDIQSPDGLDDALREELSPIVDGAVEPRIDKIANWPKEPTIRAGYSFLGVGELTETGQLLADGLGRVQFAGDWASFGFRGYMEGALQSGRRAACNLLQ